jgi:hypothetical protein
VVAAPEAEHALLAHGAVAIAAGMSDPPPPQLLDSSATASAAAGAVTAE